MQYNLFTIFPYRGPFAEFGFGILSVILTKYHYIILTDYHGIQFHGYIFFLKYINSNEFTCNMLPG